MAGEIEAVATTENVAMATVIGSDAASFALKMATDAMALVQQNIWWGFAILALMWVENAAIEHFDVPIPAGKVRWVLLFFATMFFSWIWVDLVGGMIPNG